MTNNNSEKHPQDTEQAILIAAEQEFLNKGFAGARTTSIAEAAGVTHAMLHYYFRSKAKLFDRIVTSKVALLKEALLRPVEEGNATLETVIRGIVERHLDLLAANPQLPGFLIGEICSGSEHSEVFVKQIGEHAPAMFGALQAKIDEAAARGVCRKTDARMLMLDIASLNIFSFMAAPAVRAALGDLMADSEAFLAERKKNNVDTIMRKLKP